LERNGIAVNDHLLEITDGEPKYGETTVLLPKLTDAPVNTVAGLAKTALIGMGCLVHGAQYQC
jgi:glycerol kinase